MIWLMVNLKIWLKELNQIKFWEQSFWDCKQCKIWGLASMVYKFFDKKSTGSGVENEIKQN